jgi:error-prone DNA polymerase
MKAGREVVEAYGHVGLTLRDHPIAFLRPELTRDKFMTCAAASAGAGRTKLQSRGFGLDPPKARLGEERHLHHP